MEETTNLPAVATPQQLVEHAGHAAAACKAIVLQTAVTIQNRKYVKVEGWQAIAIAHGCVASARDVEEIATGWRAIGEVRRMDNGVVIAAAEGFVGKDEPTWSKRAEFACRAMAQTRAISRACRSAFAHVVCLLNAGLETTPAEEMEAVHASLPPRGGSSAPPAAPAPVRTSGGPVISEPMRKRMYAIWKGAGHDDEDVKLWLGQLYGIGSSKEVTKDSYEAICERLKDKTPLTADIPAQAEDEIPETWPEVGSNG